MNQIRRLAQLVARSSGQLALAEAWGRLHPKTIAKVKEALVEALEIIEGIENAKD